jgi:hypothetical protein
VKASDNVRLALNFSDPPPAATSEAIHSGRLTVVTQDDDYGQMAEAHRALGDIKV